jgi:hypothetical protein
MPIVERGIVLRQIGVAPIAENPFDEIEVAHQAAGREEPQLHRLPWLRSNLRADEWPKQQRHPQACLFLLIGCERKPENIIGWLKRASEQTCESLARNRNLVRWNRQATLHHVEDPLCRTAIAARVMQDPLRHTIGFQV